ncbi:efflux transporter outer membrane subunit [Denitratimonas sp. CY0512]|uniref:efflux transporter outer membrane subunit n=1 Tax=Denitratimonas sp. CY0512 TaxID=3131940 RepID=UPI0030AD0D47
MTKFLNRALAAAVVVFVAGCATPGPRGSVADADPMIPTEWPLPASTGVAGEGATTALPDIGWRDFFADPRLQEVVGLALDNNRDLRVAILNVDRARAQHRIQRADRFPNLGINAQMERVGADNPALESETYSVGLGVTAFELDLFGRVRNLSQAALQQYLATEESQRGAQLALVAEVANLWLTLAADREQLRIAQATLATYEESLELNQARRELGAISQLVLEQTRTQVASARADVARISGLVQRDINALNLLAGVTLEPRLLPDGMVQDVVGLGQLPEGLPAEVLLRRPDIIAAEHRLLGADANISAARAAFFPSIRLTGNIGSVSTELSGLFESNTTVWSFIPQINIPIFQGGRLRAALGMAQADRDIALAQYEKAIQNGFREVADALALSATLAEQVDASQALLEAATNAERLAKARYDAGLDSNLVRLDAQRTLYAAQQQVVAVRMAEQANRVTLYKVLGGGWTERN